LPTLTQNFKRPTAFRT